MAFQGSLQGWKSPQKDWSEWVQRLAAKHKSIWGRSGIYDAILSSTYEVRRNVDVVLGLAEFWCPESSSFLFPWGEATITLEDMMILGGYTVSGMPIRRRPTGKLVKIVEEMERQRRKLCQSKAKKASHQGWLKHYMGADNGLEHVAFLLLWLSRYVFPHLPDETVGKHVFPIAAFLSEGTPMALAPAVLASLYRDLTLLKKEAMSFSESIAVAAPFQLLQLWAFERFPSLGPKVPNSLDRPGEPRAARWSNFNSRINLQLVKSAVRLKENFTWRPYAANLKDWQHLSFYKEKKQLVFDCSGYDKELRFFAQCLQATELVGMDCKQKYQPQRVAMQFGFDQDIPGAFHRSSVTREHIKLSVPARSFEPGVSARYLRWWEDSMFARENAIREILSRKGCSNYGKTSTSAKLMGSSESCWTDKQVPAKCGSEGSSSPAFPRNTGPNVIRERNDETDLLPISMLRVPVPDKATMKDRITSKQGAISRYKYTSSASLIQKGLGKPIQGPKYDGHGHKNHGVKPPVIPHFSSLKNASNKFASLYHSSTDEFPSKTQRSTAFRKREPSPPKSEGNIQKTSFPMGLEQNGSLAGRPDASLLKANEDPSDSLDFLFLSERIKRNKIGREPQKDFPAKAEAVEEGEIV